MTPYEFEILLEYRGETVIIDSDQNNIAEVIICLRELYISEKIPAILKVILHEGKSKYTLDGYEYFTHLPKDIDSDFDYNLSHFSKEEIEETPLFQSGRYKNETDFSNAPEVFLKEAKKVWKYNVHGRYKNE